MVLNITEFVKTEIIGVLKSEHCAALARNKHLDFFKLDYVRNKIENEEEVLKALYQEQLQKQKDKEEKGVGYRSDCKKWYIQLRLNGKQKKFGCFATKEEAYKRRNELIIELNLPEKDYLPYPLDD